MAKKKKTYIAPAIDTVKTNLAKSVLAAISTQIHNSGSNTDTHGPSDGGNGDDKPLGAKGTVWDEMGESGNVWE